jgi:hypothetical protein
MKKFIVLLVFSLFFLGCSALFETTTLTIINNSSYHLLSVKWNNIYFCPDEVDNHILGEKTLGMRSGNSETLDVEPGTSAVYFYFDNIVYQYRTYDIITVSKGKNVKFTFIDETLVQKVE